VNALSGRRAALLSTGTAEHIGRSQLMSHRRATG
jgi:hypothetical protein